MQVREHLKMMKHLIIHGINLRLDNCTVFNTPSAGSSSASNDDITVYSLLKVDSHILERKLLRNQIRARRRDTEEEEEEEEEERSLLEQDFSKIKERAQEEKAPPGDDPPTTSHLDTPPQNNATDEPHLMDHSLMEMRDRFTQMEIRQVELEQQLNTHQSSQTTVQPTTRSKNGERDMSALWTLLRELQDKEEVLSTSPEETLPQQQVDDSPNTSAETDQLPSNPPTPNNTTARCPEDTPTSNEETQNPQIVLLIDSNGKYIEEKKLFPKHRVAKLRCRNTQHALELLTRTSLGRTATS
ncbi:unnamed protein product [Arctogadus glacialis]